MPDSFQDIVSDFQTPNSIQNDFNLFIVHYLFGPFNNPYSLRRTKVEVGSSSYLHKLKSSEYTNKSHERVIKEYIRYLERNYTFLQLILNTFNDYPDANILIGELKLIRSNVKPIYSPKISNIDQNKIIAKWRINQKTSNIVAPLENTRDFLQLIYSNQPVTSEWIEDFKLCRADLFGKVCSNETTILEKRKKWQEISSIQSGILYFKAAVAENLSASEIG